MGMKEDLQKISDEVVKGKFEANNAYILDKMYAAAREGKYEITANVCDLNDDFKDYIFNSGFYIYGLKPGYVNFFEPIFHRIDLDLWSYKVIKIKW